MFVGLPPKLIISLSVQFIFSLRTRMCERKIWLFTRNCFHEEFLELLESYLVILTSKKVIISTSLYLKVTNSALHYFFLEMESWSQPYYMFVGLPPKLIISLSVQFIFSLRTRMCEKKIWLFTMNCFHEKILEFQSYSKHKQSFWCWFKANLFWK